MRQILTTGIGKKAEMRIVMTTINIPGDDEVQIRVKYSGFAWADVVMKSGNYPQQPKTDFVQGYDLVGEVVAVGSKVPKEWLGKNIAAIIQWGGYSEYINLSQKHIIEIPPGIDLKEAETLLLNYVTAYQTLKRVAQIKDEQKILIHGGAGGVGTALLQLAKLNNIKCYATASESKKNIVESLGGIFIDYKNERFDDEIKKQEPNGIDAFFDFNGGETFDRSFKLLKSNGIGVVYNIQEAKSIFEIIFYFMKFWFLNRFSSKRVQFYSIMSRYAKIQNEYYDDLQSLFSLLSSRNIQPVIGAVVSLSDVPSAHRDFEQNKFVGKVVVDCNR